MKVKKVVKILGIVFGVIILLITAVTGYSYYQFHYSLIPKKGKFEHASHYINPKTALLNEDFVVCDEKHIFQYYNVSELPYLNGKNKFRDYVNTHYKNQNYSDSGYLNIRFIINCKGEAGRFVIHENNLDLEPTKFNRDLKEQLFKLTSTVQWKPTFLYEENRDAYMYVSYRIENGEVTEIIP